jgi:hypothetical protein
MSRLAARRGRRAAMQIVCRSRLSPVLIMVLALVVRLCRICAERPPTAGPGGHEPVLSETRHASETPQRRTGKLR